MMAIKWNIKNLKFKAILPHIQYASNDLAKEKMKYSSNSIYFSCIVIHRLKYINIYSVIIKLQKNILHFYLFHTDISTRNNSVIK